jgi:type IX secretion system PorP/SprF family membrane protein
MTSQYKISPMKRFILIVFLISCANNFAQELTVPAATQYLADNPFVISPSYAGIGDNVRIRANGFAQWLGIKDAPQNQALYADFRIADQSGIGVSFYNDKNGYTKQSGAKFSFAHHIILDYYSKQFLSFGISYNLNNFRIEVDKFQSNTGTGFDPSVVNDRRTSNNNFDLGLLYRKGGFFTSFNVSNILNKDIKKFYLAEPNLLRNYQIYSGYTYKSNRDSRIELEPSLFYQYFQNDGRSSTDLNFKIRYLDRQRLGYYWLGATYRFLNDQAFKPLTIGPMVGLKKSNFYFAYSYQVTLNDLVGFNSGTHMITLGLDFFQGLSNCPCTQTEVNY